MQATAQAQNQAFLNISEVWNKIQQYKKSGYGLPEAIRIDCVGPGNQTKTIYGQVTKIWDNRGGVQLKNGRTEPGGYIREFTVNNDNGTAWVQLQGQPYRIVNIGPAGAAPARTAPTPASSPSDAPVPSMRPSVAVNTEFRVNGNTIEYGRPGNLCHTFQAPEGGLGRVTAITPRNPVQPSDPNSGMQPGVFQYYDARAGKAYPAVAFDVTTTSGGRDKTYPIIFKVGEQGLAEAVSARGAPSQPCQFGPGNRLTPAPVQFAASAQCVDLKNGNQAWAVKAQLRSLASRSGGDIDSWFPVMLNDGEGKIDKITMTRDRKVFASSGTDASGLKTEHDGLCFYAEVTRPDGRKETVPGYIVVDEQGKASGVSFNGRESTREQAGATWNAVQQHVRPSFSISKSTSAGDADWMVNFGMPWNPSSHSYQVPRPPERTKDKKDNDLVWSVRPEKEDTAHPGQPAIVGYKDPKTGQVVPSVAFTVETVQRAELERVAKAERELEQKRAEAAKKKEKPPEEKAPELQTDKKRLVFVLTNQGIAKVGDNGEIISAPQTGPVHGPDGPWNLVNPYKELTLPPAPGKDRASGPTSL